MNWMLLSLILYLAVQVAIGLWIAPRIQNESDFLVAGRNLGYPLTIFSIFATWFGAETVIASGGRAWSEGFALTTAEPMAYGLCVIVMGLVFAAPLWNRQLTTLADLFRVRYSPGIERLAAAIVIPSSILWAAAQLRGFAHVLTSVTSLGLPGAIAVGALVCIVYTVLGGLLADAVTDLIQGIVIVIGLGVLAWAVMARLGGPGEALAAIPPGRVAVLGGGAGAGFLAILEEWAIPVVGSVVAAELISRVIAARSPAVARNGAVIGGGMYIVVGLIPVAIGLSAGGLIPPVDDPDRFLPSLAMVVLPPWAYVIFAGAIISAILSTVNTILLVSGGIAAHNVVVPILKVTDPKRALRLSQWGVAVFGLVAWLIAISAEGVGSLVEQASALGSAGAVVTVTFGLFTGIGGPRAAAGALVGGLVVYLAAWLGGLPYPFLSSLAAATLLYLAGAAWDRRR